VIKLIAAMVQDQDVEKVLGALMESRRRSGSVNQRCLPDGGGGKAKLRAHIDLAQLALESAIHYRAKETGFVPQTTRSQAIDDGLAKAAVELSLEGGPSRG